MPTARRRTRARFLAPAGRAGRPPSSPAPAAPAPARAAVVAGLALLALAGCGAAVTFSSRSQERIAGTLLKPAGAGPFPAVVLMHGCGGLQYVHESWALDLARWGYVALLVDSFNPRGFTEICTSISRLPAPRRALDAYGALDYLRSLPFVDKERVAVMGWSHGGTTALASVSERGRPPEGGFRAAVTLYPYCQLYSGLNAPVLILIGDADDWTPAWLCDALKEHPNVELKVYRGARHSFDDPRPLRTYIGHVLGYDAAATADARQRVKDFLDRHLRR